MLEMLYCQTMLKPFWRFSSLFINTCMLISDHDHWKIQRLPLKIHGYETSTSLLPPFSLINFEDLCMHSCTYFLTSFDFCQFVRAWTELYMLYTVVICTYLLSHLAIKVFNNCCIVPLPLKSRFLILDIITFLYLPQRC